MPPGLPFKAIFGCFYPNRIGDVVQIVQSKENRTRNPSMSLKSNMFDATSNESMSGNAVDYPEV